VLTEICINKVKLYSNSKVMRMDDWFTFLFFIFSFIYVFLKFEDRLGLRTAILS